MGLTSRVMAYQGSVQQLQFELLLQYPLTALQMQGQGHV